MVILIITLLIIVITSLIKVYQLLKHKNCVSKKRLDGKTVLVTGGTAGMGLEVAMEMARRGARVIIACHFPEEGTAAREKIMLATDNKNVEFQKLDLASLESTRYFAANILAREPHLHLLVNNAGVSGPANRTTPDGLNFLMQVNYFGAVLLTMLLLPLLKKLGRQREPSRIVNVASKLHSLGKIDLTSLNESSNGATAYSKSKLCLVIFTQELAKKLEREYVVVNSLEPGTVGTRIFFNFFGYVAGHVVLWLVWWVCKTPWQGAQTTLHVALDEDAGTVSGEYFEECRISRAAERAYDEDLSARFWKESLRLVKFSPTGDSATLN